MTAVSKKPSTNRKIFCDIAIITIITEDLFKAMKSKNNAYQHYDSLYSHFI